MSAKKNKLLGMNFSTANNRLKKQVMFMLVKNAGLDICFRCNKQISSVTELSLEHKKSWSEDVALFWDLDNISFSHQTCNYTHGAGVTNGKRWAPPQNVYVNSMEYLVEK
jgi:5-methylcytosine-specific restriction endonuclease McrA